MNDEQDGSRPPGRPSQANVGRPQGRATSPAGSSYDHALRLARSGQLAQAISTLRGIPPSELTHESATLLALCLRNSGNMQAALSAAERALELNPDNAMGWLIKGSVEVQRGSIPAGEASLLRCLSLDPDLAEAWHFLGEALHAQSRWREALSAYGSASRRQPAEVFNMGICLEHLGQLHDARQAYLAMQRLHPDRTDCLSRLAQVESMMCMFPEASRTSAALESRLLQAESLSANDHPEIFPVSYLDISPAAKRGALKRYASRIESRTAPATARANPSPLPTLPLRIAYISADFGDHAVGQLIQHIFDAHDRSSFDVFGYSLRQHNDPIGDRIRTSLGRGFRDCSHLSDDDAADCIRTDRIDVLIDLGGFTHGSRPGILATRPAPRQVGWLGFIHAQEAPWLDGILLDKHLVPDDAHWPYNDTVIPLPGTMFPAGPMTAGVEDRRSFGIPEDAFVFASFNNSYKITIELAEAWREILQGCGHALLMLYLPPYARNAFLANWSSIGGSIDRLRIVDKIPPQEQASRAASCDLFLDAFAYQAGATAISSIAAGLPILSRTGTTPLARLGTSLNRFLQLEELVCPDTRAYIDRAVELGNSPTRMRQLREKMTRNSATAGLFDPTRAAGNIESICQAIRSSKLD